MPKGIYIHVGRPWSKTRTATCVPTISEIILAAGWFEGEDSANRHVGTTTAKVVQKDRWLLTKLQQWFGGTITNHDSSGCGHWQVYGDNARRFLRAIYMYLSPRRKWQIARTDTFDYLEVGCA